MEAAGRREVGGCFSRLRQEADTEPQVRSSCQPASPKSISNYRLSPARLNLQEIPQPPLTIEARLGTECSIP